MTEDLFMAHQELRRSLTLRDGLVLAIGSVAGQGILYIPSLTYVIAGHDVLLVWLAAILLCLPLLFMFTDMVRLVPDGSGVEGFVARGLGPHIAATVPLLFLSVVILGIPAGVLVAGEYLRSAIGGGTVVQLVGALAILLVAIITNLVGAAVGARVQQYVCWALIIVVVALCVLISPQLNHGYNAVLPTLSAPEPILSGIVVAFWAYVGFENLTFIAGEFRNPDRDFPLVMIIAFLVYGGLSIALTVIIAALIPREQVSGFSGLFQLAERINPAWLSTSIVVAFAFALLQLNAASWLWGMSRLLYASASMGRLPHFFAHLDSRGLPRRAILLLGSAFVVMTVITAVFPDLLVGVLTVASSVFLFLYLLCLLSYLRITQNYGKRLVYGVFFLFLLTTLVSIGLKILYPIGVFLLALLSSIVRERRLASHRREERRRAEDRLFHEHGKQEQKSTIQ
jgi:amino acid efflux transporter